MKIVIGWFGVTAVLLFANGCSDEVLGKVECKGDEECPKGHECHAGTCVLECETFVECDDGNICTLDLCDHDIGCVYEPAGLDGEVCEADGLDTTRDICLGMTCAPSTCGDLWVDAGQEPAEDCDDGGNIDGDGCQANCTYLPPTLQITAPERAQTLTGDNTVNVTGTTGDPWHGLQSFTINGFSVDVEADGSFTYPMTASWGVNTVEAVAVSNNGKSNRRALGYYFADAYASYADPIADTLPLEDVLMTRVSQDAIDDFDHPCGYDQDDVFVCTEVDDIATLGEISLNNLDLSEGLGSIVVYHQTTPIITQSYPFNSAVPIVPNLSVSGDLLVTGEVNIDVAITDLDFNQLALMLASRSGGVNAEIAIDEHGGVPGFVAHVQTTVEVPIQAAFDPATLAITYSFAGNNYNTLALACPILEVLGYGEDVAVICAGASIVGLEPHPTGTVGSEISIERMLMTASFDIYTAPGGGVVVELVGGNTDFFGSEILVDPIASMEIDLGSIDILGVVGFPLGQVPVSGLASGLNTALSSITEAFVNDLQFLVQGAVNLLLLNENDPLSVGLLLQGAVEGMAPNRALELAPFGGQSEAPAVSVQSNITAVDVDPYLSTNLNIGGITSTFEVLYSSTPDRERDALGSLLGDGCYPATSVAFPETASLEMAQHLDSINQTLFAVWQAGGFDFAFNDAHLPAGSDLGDETFALNLQARGAPILNSCDGAPLALEIADVFVSGAVNGEAFSGFVSLSVPVAISAANDALVLSAQGTPTFVIDPLVGVSVGDVVGDILYREVVLPYSAQILTAMPTFVIDLSALGGDPTASRLEMLPQNATAQGPFTMTTGVAGQ